MIGLKTISKLLTTLPVKVGLVGTGYAAKLRAETLQTDSRAKLVAVTGHTLEKTEAFSQTFGAEAVNSWHEMVVRSDIDLVIVATINRDHSAIALAALQAGKHVVVEYPLSLNPIEAAELIALAQVQDQLLHVEHIELLGGVHQALKANLPAVGEVFYTRYATISPQNPAPQRWTYEPDLFGFPLVGALSRLHRLTDLFGQVSTVSCQNCYWDAVGTASPYYSTCICTAQLRFKSGLLAEVTYGKGEALWQAVRLFEVQGEKGALVFDGDQGTLVQSQTQPIEVGSRRGLFAKDTTSVLDYLLQGASLYTTPQASLYTLKVADAARRSAETGQTIQLE